MKVDLYTKTILTVIAIALVSISSQNFIKNAEADNHIQKVAICNIQGEFCTKVTKYNGNDTIITYSPENAKLNAQLYGDMKKRVNAISAQLNAMIYGKGRK